MDNRPKKVFPNMKATMETKQKEPYEAPAVLDITPVTVNGSAGVSPGDGDYDDGGAD